MTCIIKGCDKTVKYRKMGICAMHYNRFRRHQDFTTVKRRQSMPSTRRHRQCLHRARNAGYPITKEWDDMLVFIDDTINLYSEDPNMVMTRIDKTKPYGPGNVHWVRRGENNHMPPQNARTTKLTWDIVREIRAKFEAGGITKKALAEEYNVTPENIYYITTYQTWKEQ